MEYGDAIDLDGEVRGGKVKAVELLADEFPWGDPKRVGQAKVRPDGTFTFAHKPDYNVRYRARVPGGDVDLVSNEVTYQVFPKSKVNSDWVDSKRARFVATVTGPKSATPLAGKYHFYIHGDGEPRYTRIGSAKAKVRSGRATVKLVAIIPPEIDEYDYMYCKEGLDFEGMGQVPRGGGSCGAPTKPFSD